MRGYRAINKFEACVVRRIFSNYVSGKSPKRIAFELNKEGIKAPSGGDWGFSTINGQPATRHRYLEQRDVCRPDRLEPTTLYQGPGHGQACVEAEPGVGVDLPQRARAAHH